ncbi:hypothetical protein Tsp_05090 [Trichinella spiralis]|uniref:hypothetical protein n=1 Tax=Trichinella spiralis TaxID=6334 RepID=UPI0001EFED0F|nr:hypothetical protein Tsp_05090 [Trichinella spiralis]
MVISNGKNLQQKVPYTGWYRKIRTEPVSGKVVKKRPCVWLVTLVSLCVCLCVRTCILFIIVCLILNCVPQMLRRESKAGDCPNASVETNHPKCAIERGAL